MDTFVGTAAPLFDMAVERLPDVLVVGLAGELDLACEDALAELVAVELAGLDRSVVFDLARLDFIDLTGARLLGEAGGLVTRSGWSCTVASPSPLAARVIRYAGFAELLADRAVQKAVLRYAPRHSLTAKGQAANSGLYVVGGGTAGPTPGDAAPGMGPGGQECGRKETRHGGCSGNRL